MKRITKLAAAAVCTLAIAATVSGALVTGAFAQSQPTVDEVVYGQTKTVSIDFELNGTAKTVTCTEAQVTGSTVKLAKIKGVAVNGNKATIEINVKGIDANYGRKVYTTVTPRIVIDGTAYTGKVYASIRCLRAPQTITCKKVTVKKATVKNKAVTIKLNPKASGVGKAYITKCPNTWPLSGKKKGTTLTMKKHRCKSTTAKHSVKVKLTAAGNRNYAPVTVTKIIKVIMK